MGTSETVPSGPRSQQGFRLPVGPDQQINDPSREKEGRDGPRHTAGAGEQHSQLIKHQGHDISEHALIADGEPGPPGTCLLYTSPSPRDS